MYCTKEIQEANIKVLKFITKEKNNQNDLYSKPCKLFEKSCDS
jgi:hypothetical protein